jgi:hypothetical protein
MLIPILLSTIGAGQGAELLDGQTRILCEIAFAIAASTMAIYRLFLERNTRNRAS